MLKKKLNRLLSVSLIIVLMISLSSCGTILRKVRHDFKKNRRSHRTQSNIQNEEKSRFSINTETNIESESDILPTDYLEKTTEPTNKSTKIENSTDPDINHTSNAITEPTTQNTNSSSQLLTADDFTTELILKNGTLYERRKEFDPAFIRQALEYFPEIAGGNEFDPNIEHILHRRDVHQDIRIARFDIQEEDQRVMDRIFPVVETLTGLTITYDDWDYNMEIHIAPLSEFEHIFGNEYVPGNWGFVVFYYDPYDYIDYAVMAVSNDMPNRLEMNHLIIEEFIQSLGLPNDSYTYPDSIYQQEWTSVQEPSPLDWLLLEFVYRPELEPGMHIDQCVEILESLYLD